MAADWLQPGTVWGFVAGFLSGVSVPVFVVHYNDGLQRHRKRQAAARFLIHELDKVRAHLTGIVGKIDTLAESLGEGVVRDNIEAIGQHREAIERKEDLLFDLHDANLQNAVESLLDSWKTTERQFNQHISAPRVYAGNEPPDRTFMSAYRIYQEGIRSSILNIDGTLQRLRQLDVPFVSWVIHRARA